MFILIDSSLLCDVCIHLIGASRFDWQMCIDLIGALSLIDMRALLDVHNIDLIGTLRLIDSSLLWLLHDS